MNTTNANVRAKGTLDATKDGTMQLLVGPMPKGPKRCIKCGKEFKNGEAWRRLTSNADTQYGRYSIGMHEKCVGK